MSKTILGIRVKTLGRLVPNWTRPLARKMFGPIRSIVERAGNAESVEHSYRRRLIAHPNVHEFPPVRTSFIPERDPLDLDVEAARRVAAAYEAATRGNTRASAHAVDDLWDGLALRFHGELIDLLRRGDAHALARYLCNMSRHNATAGVTQGEDEFNKLAKSTQYRDWLGLMILDRLVALAEFAGVLRVENPEQGPYGESFKHDVDWLIERIEEKLGVGIVPPQIEGCLFGLGTRSGILSFRDITALYAASRIGAIANSREQASICEIGAGVGRVAYYCRRLGIRNYDIYDLPLINVLQGYFLIRAMPECRVFLFGESGADAKGGVRILPGWALARAPAKSFDLVLNQDSFPEIDRGTVVEYLRQIARATRGQFLSINHEANTPIAGSTFMHASVAEMAQEVGGLQLSYRFPCWVRAGYVEELYKVL